MDRGWMYKSRLDPTYLNGVQEFLNLAFSRASVNNKITCPCVECGNGMWVSRAEAAEHLVCFGFIKGYTKWVAHGESSSSVSRGSPQKTNIDNCDDMHGLLNDIYRNFETDDSGLGKSDVGEEPNADAKIFYKLVNEAEEALYPGCKKFSKLSFIVRLFHIKCLGKMTNAAFTMLLDLLKEALPEGETLPKSYYETKKIIRELGLSYNKIDACPNDCMLYWKERINDSECHICHTSRWKANEQCEEDEANLPVRGKKIAAKVLRHFPLIPRLQRLFMSSKIASFMQWHKDGRTKDGRMRHPADSPAWQTFDFRNADFAKDARNVRLGLASDGFNPFRTMSVAHSTWPVILVPYNLPPWMCMKQPNFILSLLIPGYPGNNIDVYLQPLVDELKELWEVGVNTFDSATKQNFQMRAALLWTISDFPAYANLSGWSTKGKLACPSCHMHTCSQWLEHSGKFCYMGHRRFLDSNHVFRKDKQSFDGTEDHRKAPPRLTGRMVLNDLSGFEFRFGKEVKDNPELPYSWKKLSIFFELPYWKDNLLRHNLDVMHIEKNVCDSVVGTLLQLDGKMKDHLKARLDLQNMGIRHELHPKTNESNRVYLPPACFSMNKKEKAISCSVLKNVKVPDGYAANISRCVNIKQHKISGLKSHDNHILMQQLLPLALRRVLPKEVQKPFIELCKFFRILCSKTLSPRDMVQLEGKITKTLCDLERILPPSFFDIMVHLPIHLATEAKLAGPVQYRWMYPIERYLSTLKSYVRNRNRPEGSIAEGYLADECLTFCSRYLAETVETKMNRGKRNDDDGGCTTAKLSIFLNPGRSLQRNGEIVTFQDEILTKAHQYVLFNCVEVEEFLQMHQDMIRNQNPRMRLRDIERKHNENFASWFKNFARDLHLMGDERISEELRVLARGPNDVGKRYNAFIVNGFRFHTKDLEKRRKTQNSGVIITAKTSSFSSAKDNNPVVGDVTYYGVLKDIIELEYFGKKTVVLFKCDWVAEGKKRKRQDTYGYTLVNFEGLVEHKEPFVLASQVQQVFYVADPIDKGWKVVMKATPRDYFDMDADLYVDDAENNNATEAFNDPSIDLYGEVNWVREDGEGMLINISD